MGANANWEFVDGWILMSIFLASRSSSVKLEAVFAAADAMNHAIPTQNEISESLSKLLAIGAVQLSENKFSIEPAHLQSITNIYNKRGGLFETPNKGVTWLTAIRATVPEDYSTVELSEQDYSAAYERYRRT